MTVKLAGDAICLVGDCSSRDVEVLLQLILDYPEAELDWKDCTSADSVIVQLLLASDRSLKGRPKGQFLATFVAPSFRQSY